MPESQRAALSRGGWSITRDQRTPFGQTSLRGGASMCCGWGSTPFGLRHDTTTAHAVTQAVLQLQRSSSLALYSTVQENAGAK
jgi:hypothetical protein